jgi:hypothetical protein
VPTAPHGQPHHGSKKGKPQPSKQGRPPRSAR